MKKVLLAGLLVLIVGDEDAVGLPFPPATTALAAEPGGGRYFVDADGDGSTSSKDTV